MNKVLLTGRLTRDPEIRSTASGKTVASLSLATNEYIGNGKERAEFHSIVAWGRLAETCGRFLGKGQQITVEGRIQTRTWDDTTGKRHWRTEVVAATIEMLSGRRKKDYATEQAAGALEARATRFGGGEEPDEDEAASVAASEPIPDDAAFALGAGVDDDEDEEDELLEEAVA